MADKEFTGERELIRGIRAMLPGRAGSGIRIGIGDDCAVLAPKAGEELVLTTDFSIEGRHFRRAWHTPEAIGHKCLARGLSDVAAMGARPVAAFVSLAIPPGLAAGSRKNPAWIKRFYHGLLALAEREKVTLAGGDLAQSPFIAVADIVVVGAARRGAALLRAGALPGDTLYVTGALGGAAAELAALRKDPRSFRGLVADTGGNPHFFPQPRIAAGQALLRRKLATACIDISDGLSVDLLHLCEESNVSAELDADAIPVHSLASLEQAIHGGDDYELLFTARPGAPVPRRIGGVPVHPIGQIVARTRRPRMVLIVRRGQGRPRGKDPELSRETLRPQGWQHFNARPAGHIKK